MRFTLFMRRLGFGLLLVITLAGGWLLHGVLPAPTAASTERTLAMNTPLYKATVPISSVVESSTGSKPVPLFALNAIISNQFKLAAGLNPGRGQPIPAAADVRELPVIDVTFCDISPRLQAGGFSSSRVRVSCFNGSCLSDFRPNGSSTPSTGRGD